MLLNEPHPEEEPGDSCMEVKRFSKELGVNNYDNDDDDNDDDDNDNYHPHSKHPQCNSST